MISKQRQKELFDLMLENLELEKSGLKAPELPELDFGKKELSEGKTLLVKNIAFFNPLTGEVTIIYRKVPRNKAGEDLPVDAVFDVLGFFDRKTLNTIFLVPENICRFCMLNGVETGLISEIIYIHECAHYVHCALNPKDFSQKRLRLNYPDVSSRKFYIETYAQWCTWAVCNALDDENGKDVYRDIFSKICETQLPEYSNFKHFIYHNAEVIHKVFLMENGKPYFNEFLKQSYGGKIKVCYSRLEVELTVLMGDWGFTEDKNYAKLFEGEFVENVYLATERIVFNLN